MTPTAPQLDQAAIAAIQRWKPGASAKPLKDLSGGRSGALVRLLDIVPGDGDPGLSGQFVLKVSSVDADAPAGSDEASRHLLMSGINPDFARLHIPSLVRSDTAGGFAAGLYRVAGFGIDFVRSVEALGRAGGLETCAAAAHAILHSLNEQYTIAQHSSNGKVLSEWLADRLDPRSARGQRLQGIADTLCAGASSFPFCNTTRLANPLEFCRLPAVQAESLVSLNGVLHGDFHPGNILCNANTRDREFWIIDFALARPGPLFFDHAYLELGLMRTLLDAGAEPGSLHALFLALDDPHAIAGVSTDDIALCDAIRKVRAAIERWRAEREPDRGGPVTRQLLLARVAAGLNWASKSFDDAQEGAFRAVAFNYAAWSATQFLRDFCRKGLDALLPDHVPAVPDAADRSLGELLAELGPPDRDRLVLVTGARDPGEDMTSLAGLPLSLVLDLDPRSDTDGLLRALREPLSQRRFVHLCGRHFDESLIGDRGVTWMMAGGWESDDTPAPDFLEWRRADVPRIRRILECFRAAIAPTPATFVVLPGPGLEPARVSTLVEVVYEVFGRSGRVIVVGAAPATEFPMRPYPDLPVPRFLSALRSLVREAPSSARPTVPGMDAQKNARLVEIPIETLRNLEEDFDVLHSATLAMAPLQDDPTVFWRGNPPTWHDLHAERDVPREVLQRLLDGSAGTLPAPPAGEDRSQRGPVGVLEYLKSNRNGTVELRHHPGSGGTTVALRLAWRLRDEFPVAVLTRYSKNTDARLRELHALANRPILLVADSSVIPEADREKLYASLVANNTRVVILYVSRHFKIDHTRHHALVDPMPSAEAERFRHVYSLATTDPNRKVELARITHATDPETSRYRTPFFYGLTAFEDQFQAVDRYVRSRIEGLSLKQRAVLAALAMVTRYAQRGLNEELVAEMLHDPRHGRLDLVEHFGASAASLVTGINGRLKLLHPLIARQVLMQIDPDWQVSLKDHAIDFIGFATGHAGSDAAELHDLFLQMFISRRDDAALESVSGLHTTTTLFSPLIEDISGEENQQQVFEELTNRCPQEPHYWNHRARHLIYRLRTRYDDAEEYFRKAIELSGERDPFHWHGLGMAKRIRIENYLSSSDSEEKAPSEILAEVAPRAEEAFACFTRARALNPEKEHAYVTHVQLVHRIVERLLLASRASNIAVLASPSPDVAAWLRSHLDEAHNLLHACELRRVSDHPSHKFNQVARQIKSLYGNHDALIKEWQSQLERNPADADLLRRSLVNAYLSRRDRKWESLTTDELRHIQSLLHATLLRDPTNEYDLRKWFQASKRLPDFSYIDAVGRLQALVNRTDSLDAHYYLYILYLLQRLRGQERDERDVLDHINRCKDLSQYMVARQVQFEWLGNDPHLPCPLIHRSELGPWSHAADSFEHAQEKLALVPGRIERIDSPVKGWIRLASSRHILAFFQPREKFHASKNISDTVQFYLGFSYDGPQAFSVRKAEVVSPSPSAPRPANLPAPSPEKRTAELLSAFVRSVAAQKRPPGKDLTTEELGVLVSHKFAAGQTYKLLGFKNLSEYLASFNDLEVYPNAAGRTCVRMKT
jgi:tetratricopeptide (TPR) repeat protein